MKKLLLILFIIPLFSNSIVKVYVCTGTTSKRYHNSTDCKGMLACKGTTNLVTLDVATNLGKTPCRFCFPSNNLQMEINRPLKKGEVYICTGSSSKRYHNATDCKGMLSCSGTAKIVMLVKAKKIGKTPCGFCYPTNKPKESDSDKEWWGDKYP